MTNFGKTWTNNQPGIGGRDTESTDEIRQKAMAFFTTQNRCVTKEDYEARALNMSAKFGNIAKVFVNRTSMGEVTTNIGTEMGSVGEMETIINNAHEQLLNYMQMMQAGMADPETVTWPADTVDPQLLNAIQAIYQKNWN